MSATTLSINMPTQSTCIAESSPPVLSPTLVARNQNTALRETAGEISADYPKYGPGIVHRIRRQFSARGKRHLPLSARTDSVEVDSATENSSDINAAAVSLSTSSSPALLNSSSSSSRREDNTMGVADELSSSSAAAAAAQSAESTVDSSRDTTVDVVDSIHSSYSATTSSPVIRNTAVKYSAEVYASPTPRVPSSPTVNNSSISSWQNSGGGGGATAQRKQLSSSTAIAAALNKQQQKQQQLYGTENSSAVHHHAPSMPPVTPPENKPAAPLAPPRRKRVVLPAEVNGKHDVVEARHSAQAMPVSYQQQQQMKKSSSLQDLLDADDDAATTNIVIPPPNAAVSQQQNENRAEDFVASSGFPPPRSHNNNVDIDSGESAAAAMQPISKESSGLSSSPPLASLPKVTMLRSTFEVDAGKQPATSNFPSSSSSLNKRPDMLSTSLAETATTLKTGFPIVTNLMKSPARAACAGRVRSMMSQFESCTDIGPTQSARGRGRGGGDDVAKQTSARSKSADTRHHQPTSAAAAAVHAVQRPATAIAARWSAPPPPPPPPSALAKSSVIAIGNKNNSDIGAVQLLKMRPLANNDEYSVTNGGSSAAKNPPVVGNSLTNDPLLCSPSRRGVVVASSSSSSDSSSNISASSSDNSSGGTSPVNFTYDVTPATTTSDSSATTIRQQASPPSLMMPSRSGSDHAPKVSANIARNSEPMTAISETAARQNGFPVASDATCNTNGSESNNTENKIDDDENSSFIIRTRLKKSSVPGMNTIIDTSSKPLRKARNPALKIDDPSLLGTLKQVGSTTTVDLKPLQAAPKQQPNNATFSSAAEPATFDVPPPPVNVNSSDIGAGAASNVVFYGEEKFVFVGDNSKIDKKSILKISSSTTTTLLSNPSTSIVSSEKIVTVSSSHALTADSIRRDSLGHHLDQLGDEPQQRSSTAKTAAMRQISDFPADASSPTADDDDESDTTFTVSGKSVTFHENLTTVYEYPSEKVMLEMLAGPSDRVLASTQQQYLFSTVDENSELKNSLNAFAASTAAATNRALGITKPSIAVQLQKVQNQNEVNSSDDDDDDGGASGSYSLSAARRNGGGGAHQQHPAADYEADDDDIYASDDNVDSDDERQTRRSSSSKNATSAAAEAALANAFKHIQPDAGGRSFSSVSLANRHGSSDLLF